MGTTHKIKARIWEWEGKGAWHFITIESGQATDIKLDWPWPRKGFGSIPVQVKTGQTTWKTSIFPEKGGAYLLPIKKDVRQKEELLLGKHYEFELTVIS